MNEDIHFVSLLADTFELCSLVDINLAQFNAFSNCHFEQALRFIHNDDCEELSATMDGRTTAMCCAGDTKDQQLIIAYVDDENDLLRKKFEISDIEKEINDLIDARRRNGSSYKCKSRLNVIVITNSFNCVSDYASVSKLFYLLLNSSSEEYLKIFFKWDERLSFENERFWDYESKRKQYTHKYGNLLKNLRAICGYWRRVHYDRLYKRPRNVTEQEQKSIKATNTVSGDSEQRDVDQSDTFQCESCLRFAPKFSIVARELRATARVSDEAPNVVLLCTSCAMSCTT